MFVRRAPEPPASPAEFVRHARPRLQGFDFISDVDSTRTGVAPSP